MAITAKTGFEVTKEVSLSQVKEDLLNGLTKWKKDDIGFGSLEKKYNLTVEDAVKLFANSKVAKMETRIPTLIIIDDLEEEEILPVITVNNNIEIGEKQVSVPDVQTSYVEVRKPSQKLEAFI